jgi:hypothetical protein
VPVVLIFTKFDALEDKCYSKLREQGKSYEEASIQLPEVVKSTFQNEYLACVLGAKFPPKTHVCLAGDISYSYRFYKFLQILEMNKEHNQRFELSEKTEDILDNDVLINLFVSTQKNNLDLCVKQGIQFVFYLFLFYIY